MHISLPENSMTERASPRGSVFTALVPCYAELGIILLIGVFLSLMPLDVLNDGPVLCPVRHFCGHECPSCGITRSIVCLTQGDFARSWEFNPAGLVFFLAVLKRVGVLVFAAKAWTSHLNHWMLDSALLGSFFGLALLRYCGAL